MLAPFLQTCFPDAHFTTPSISLLNAASVAGELSASPILCIPEHLTLASRHSQCRKHFLK